MVPLSPFLLSVSVSVPVLCTQAAVVANTEGEVASATASAALLAVAEPVRPLITTVSPCAAQISAERQTRAGILTAASWSELCRRMVMTAFTVALPPPTEILAVLNVWTVKQGRSQELKRSQEEDSPADSREVMGATVCVERSVSAGREIVRATPEIALAAVAAA